MNLQQAADNEGKKYFLQQDVVSMCVHSRVCVLLYAHMLITRCLHWHICLVSLSLLIAILNLAVWRAPATFALCVAAARHDTH